jgi:hypothetical protein
MVTLDKSQLISGEKFQGGTQDRFAKGGQIAMRLHRAEAGQALKG